VIDADVQFILSFSNGPLNVFQNVSSRAKVEESIAKVAGVRTETVKIIQVFNIDTKSIINLGRRRLQRANIDVTTRISVDSSDMATSLSTFIKKSPSAFANDILTDLKSKDSAFNACTISLKAESVIASDTSISTSSTSSSNSISLTTIIGITVGLIVLCILLGIGYFIYRKTLFTQKNPPLKVVNRKYIDTDKKHAKLRKDDPDVFEFQSPMRALLTKHKVTRVQPTLFHTTGEGNGHVRKVLSNIASTQPSIV
jgi:hypothetical protein